MNRRLQVGRFLAPSAALAYLYAVLIGLGYAVTAPLMPAVISDLFRGKHFGAIFGTLHVANALGGQSFAARAEDVLREIGQSVPDYAEMTFGRIGFKGQPA